jgi:hypothetical protein
MDDADVGMRQVDIDNVDTYLAATTKTLTNKTLTSPVLTTPNLGTPSAGVVTNLSGVLPSAVTGGSGLTALGTVTAGTLGAGVTFPAGMMRHLGHFVQGSGDSSVTFTNDVTIESRQVTITSGSLVKLEYVVNFEDNQSGDGFHIIAFGGNTNSGMSTYQFAHAIQYKKTTSERGSASGTFITAATATTTPTYTVQFGGTAAPVLVVYHSAFTLTEIYQ